MLTRVLAVSLFGTHSEVGNAAIGMIRKRARGLLDQNYFKLKLNNHQLKLVG